jgi:hypothetical protein
VRGQWVRRDRAGRIMLRFEPVEAETLLGVVGDLRGVLESTGDDPVTRRLFPRAYLDPTEEESETEWQALVRPDLLRTRLDALAAVTGSLMTLLTAAPATTRRGQPEKLGKPEKLAKLAKLEIVLDDVSQAQWLAVLNDARLALGTTLDITEETELHHFDAGDPRQGQFLLYSALTALQGELIDALLGER